MTNQTAGHDLPRRPCLLPAASFTPSLRRTGFAVHVGGVLYGTIHCDASGLDLFEYLCALLDGSHTTSDIITLCTKRGYRRGDVTRILRVLLARHVLLDIQNGGSDGRTDPVALCQKRWALACPPDAGPLAGSGLRRVIAVVGDEMLTGMVWQALSSIPLRGVIRLSHPGCRRPSMSALRPQRSGREGKKSFVEEQSWLNLDIASLELACAAADFTVVAVAGPAFSDAVVGEINRCLYAQGQSSLLMRVSGSQVVLGPLCIPDSESCCYDEALAGWVPPTSDSPVHCQTKPMAPVGPPAFFAGAAQLAVGIVVDAFTVGRVPVLSNRLWIMEWGTGDMRTARLLRNPRCPVCSRLQCKFPEGRVIDP